MNGAEEAKIGLRDVTKRFDLSKPTAALDSVTLDIVARKIAVLIGPSGCGKSTVLRLILHLLEPTSGMVEIDGEAVTSANAPSVRQRVGYVIQEGGLFPHLSAEQNITLMARHLEWPRAKLNARLEQLCELTHFADENLGRYPVELSGGQRQRVGLMRALMLEPDVLLLDEPLGALDPMVRARLQTDLKVIFSKLGQTIVLVTHDIAEAAYFADTIVLMNGGKIVQQGGLDDLRQRPASDFVTEFINAQRSVTSP